MPQKIYKTGIYARLSREDADRMESNSIQSQRAICLAYIESHDDLELVDTYIDDSAKIGLNQKDLNNKGADIVLFLFYIKNRFRTRSQKG